MLDLMGARSYVGTRARDKCGILVMRYPVDHGEVQSWEDLERIWEHTFYNELRVDLEGHDAVGVLMTEKLDVPKQQREQATQILFETFNAPNMFLAPDLVLSMYAAGRTTGQSVDLGASAMSTVAVFEGYSLPGYHQLHRCEAGRDQTNFLARILLESGVSMTTTAELQIVERMKQELCWVSLDFENDRENFSGSEQSFEMPDGSGVTVIHN